MRPDPLVLLAVLVAGVNLRGAIAAVSPVLPQVRAELGLSATVAGLLTSLPVLCFAVLAPAAAWLGRRLGPERAVLAGLGAIAAGTALRVLDGAPVLLAGTFVIGTGMTLGNVMLPAVVKRGFAERAGRVTGLYTTALAAGATLTAALTAPVAEALGWRVALAGWAVLAVAAMVPWALVVRRPADPAPAAPAPPTAAGDGLWRRPVAWAVAILLAVQTGSYYAYTTWLPTVLVDELDGDLAAGAVAASLFQLVGIPATLIVPALVGRRAGQGLMGGIIAAGWAALPVGLLLAPQAWPVWATLGGLAQGAGVSLAYTVVVLRAADDDAVRRLNAMTQLVGYSLGAAWPLGVGAVYAGSGGWALPLTLLAVGAVVFGAAAVVAGRPVTVGTAVPSAGTG